MRELNTPKVPDWFSLTDGSTPESPLPAYREPTTAVSYIAIHAPIPEAFLALWRLNGDEEHLVRDEAAKER
jgi:hypothetical protein